MQKWLCAGGEGRRGKQKHEAGSFLFHDEGWRLSQLRLL